MYIKLLMSRSGVGFSQDSGKVYDIEEEEAKRMIAAGQAIVVEQASKKAPETAAGKGKKRK